MIAWLKRLLWGAEHPRFQNGSGRFQDKTIDEQLAETRAKLRAFAGDRRPRGACARDLAPASPGARALARELSELKKQRWPHKCCRCWPSCVTDQGQCGCCDYEHVKGERPTPEI